MGSVTNSYGVRLGVIDAVIVSHPGKGECADPVNEDAILERVGGRRPGRNKEHQFGSDTGDGKT